MTNACLLFDCDGTLVDSERLCNIGLVQRFAPLGIKLDADELVIRFRGWKLASKTIGFSRFQSINMFLASQLDRTMTIIDEHKAVQSIAKAVLNELGPTIVPTDTERSIAKRAADLLAKHGIRETWYYDCPAFVLLGSRSCLSISGRDYVPAEEVVGPFNLVTVDLNPLRDGIWGDCARSFFIEDGAWISFPANPVFKQGAFVEAALHEAMQGFVNPQTTFEQLFEFANAEIKHHGFENLDYRGNVGHSIESSRDARRYIEQGNRQMLGDAGLFTFEPHIRRRGSQWGFKHENIYYFDSEGRAVAL